MGNETELLSLEDRPRGRPLLVKRRGAAKLTGFSLPTWDRMSAAGHNPAGFKVGGARVYRVAELEAWVRAQCPPRNDWAARWAAMEQNQTH